MWDPQRLTTLWASTACYRDSFTLPYLTLPSYFDTPKVVMLRVHKTLDKDDLLLCGGWWEALGYAHLGMFSLQ
jgi:hypothetical protein